MKFISFILKTVGRRKKAIRNTIIEPAVFFSFSIVFNKIIRSIFSSFFPPYYNHIIFFSNVVIVFGGIKGKREAIRRALSRRIIILNDKNKKIMRKYGFLTCNNRKKERRKFGLHKARKSPQYSKRLFFFKIFIICKG